MKNMCIIIYRLNLIGRPIDEVFARIDGFSRYLASNYVIIYEMGMNNLDKEKRTSVLNVIGKIKNKSRFTRISDLYF